MDYEENTIDFYLSRTSDSRTARRFFKKTLWYFPYF
ncbi:hypothetical protein COL33_21385 [Bacillus toyonensis]|nr:hypothetical protein CN674_31480 [Bacillus toyonensis]PEM95458.1 hypothetical protein CN629_11675 [Bacillus toyonensis]PEU37071.1 hypothetical protein CN537_22080 [Bacillus toyonensis]PFW89752.1 hypothetical protein COL33_21385 [Bacillus toyonensis]PHF06848.1 hypothetical protein COF83_31380 [Bacillus toyonensis]